MLTWAFELASRVVFSSPIELLMKALSVSQVFVSSRRRLVGFLVLSQGSEHYF